MGRVNTWQGLRLAVSKIHPAEGPTGFEGLAAKLFFADTKERFYLARRGDQPVGDVYSVTGGTALQVKRYHKAKVSEKEVEGDIDTALREAPKLDLFAVVLSRTDAQLRARLAHKTQETGLDIVLLELSDNLSDLGALCVCHWEITKTFLPRQSAAADRWATKMAAASETRAVLDRLREELRGRATRDVVSKLALQQLSRRFENPNNVSRAHNAVDLSQAVPRPLLSESLSGWWANSQAQAVAVLQGEEGTGKTWIGADFAQRTLVQANTSPVAFWLDSLAWAQTFTLEKLVDTALADILLPQDPRAERLKRKIFHRWAEPVLIVLDGANERGAWEAAQHLLAQLADRGEDQVNLRLLFTSRDPAGTIGVPRNLWSKTFLIRVDPFDDDEFAAALRQHAPDVHPEDFSRKVSTYARIPRYFQLCLRLRARLDSLHHLSKPLLLWTDLKDKIENGDPQILDIERELQGRAPDVLAMLARAVGWPEPGQAIITVTELSGHMPNFRSVITDLVEQRVIDNADFGEITLSADHVVLGWALVLQKLAKQHLARGFDVITEQISRLLEPASASDDKVKAVLVAALLTFFDNSADGTVTIDQRQTMRAVLLAWWVVHHNAATTVDQLAFFVAEDVSAYAAALEMLFRKHLPGDLETVLVAPLCKAWRDDKSNINALQQRLERWMRLIYPGGAEGSKDRNKTPPARFSVAASAEQLRLSYAAISIVSFRPATNLISALADCYWTISFCYHDYDPNNKDLRLPIKSTVEPLGPLLRWSYTEAALPEITRLAESLPSTGDQKEDFRWFTRLLRLADLPKVFGDAEDYIGWQDHLPEGQENFAELRAFLNKTNGGRHEPVGFGHLQWLSVRLDLPELSRAEIISLEEDMQRRIQTLRSAGYIQADRYQEQFDDLMPWVARYSPSLFATLVQELWKTALESEYVVGFLMGIDEWMPAIDLGGELISLLLVRAAALTSQENFEGAIVPLTELALLHGTLEQVTAWLRAIQDCETSRVGGSVLAINSLPQVFARFAPAGLAEIALTEFQQNWQSVAEAADDKKQFFRVRARNWLRVYAYTAEPSPLTVEWALQLADENLDDDHIRFDLFRIVNHSNDTNVFRRALFHPAFEKYHIGSLSDRWSPQFTIEQSESFTFEELAEKTSLTFTGRFLWETKRDDDLCRWGRVVASKALDVIRNLPADADGSSTRLVVNIDPAHNLKGFSFKSPSGGGESQHSVSSPAWGVDRRATRHSPTQEDHNRALAQFHADLAVWRSEPRNEFMEFNAAGPLMRWSELEPDKFAAFAKEFLEQVQREEITRIIDLGFFATVVALALLPIDPMSAMKYAEYTSDGFYTQVLTFNGALSVSIQMLWDPKLNGLAAAEAIRQQKLEEAQNDEFLLWHVLAARAGGNAEGLNEFAISRLDKPLARDRALGVSLLAFTGQRTNHGRLTHLVQNDPSFWVREHARWASEVCITECACRDRYRDALRAGDLNEMSIGLAEIRQAASPMAFIWHHEVEQEENWSSDKRIEAYLELFWYNWGAPSNRKERIQLCGRKLKDYCCGEYLKDGVTTRQYPWWKI